MHVNSFIFSLDAVNVHQARIDFIRIDFEKSLLRAGKLIYAMTLLFMT